MPPTSPLPLRIRSRVTCCTTTLLLTMLLFFCVYRQALCQKQSDLLYYNVSSRGLATGMRVGSDRRQPALAIDRQLNTCHYRGIPLRVCGVEVWGCGDSQTRDRQLHTQKREMVRVEQRRRVNLMADSYSWQENPDKYLLELSGTRQSFNYQ